MRVFAALLCAAALCSVSPFGGHFEGTCPKEAPAPGVLVVAPGSHLSLTCTGQVKLDGMLVAFPFETPTARVGEYTTPHMPPPTTVHHPGASTVIQTIMNQTGRATGRTVPIRYNPQSTTNIVTVGHGRQTHSENSRKRRDSPLGQASPEQKATSAANILWPTRGGGGAPSESDWTVGDVNREEGGRGRRPQWRLNGRTLMFREGVSESKHGAAVSISSVNADHSGRYSCHHKKKVLYSLKVIVAAPPEQPIMSCYKRSPSSKIRCEWTPQQPVVVQPHCYLYLDKGTAGTFSRLNCSFSGRPMRCWCALEHREEEKRLLHMAYLCVSSTAGNSTSPLQIFIPMGIIKPEPPSAVSVRAVEGYERLLKVSWRFPCSWKRHDQYYELVYEIQYRPASSLDSQALQRDTIKHQQYTIRDVLPMVEYVIQLRAKDEYDGLWSDWSPPVYANSWTAPPVPLWSTDQAATLDPLYMYSTGSGSGMDYTSTLESEQTQDQVWLHSLWISGLCVLLSLALAVYAFRHREKFVSKLHNFNMVTVCAADPRPPPSNSLATAATAHEGHALVTFTPARFKDPLPNAVEDQEEEEEEEEDKSEKPEKRSEAISFNNTSYFLLQTDRESVPQQSGPKCL
ncbi:unnamed protein product [Boreogadus saida]